jgi:hypothetical protein
MVPENAQDVGIQLRSSLPDIEQRCFLLVPQVLNYCFHTAILPYHNLVPDREESSLSPEQASDDFPSELFHCHQPNNTMYLSGIPVSRCTSRICNPASLISARNLLGCFIFFCLFIFSSISASIKLYYTMMELNTRRYAII